MHYFELVVVFVLLGVVSWSRAPIFRKIGHCFVPILAIFVDGVFVHSVNKQKSCWPSL